MDQMEQHRTHLCGCERCCEKCVDKLCGSRRNSLNDGYGSKCSDLADFRVYTSSSYGDDDGICLGILCFPITIVKKLLIEVPCVGYNMARNACQGTQGLDYTC
jgi:hypothetical protein